MKDLTGLPVSDADVVLSKGGKRESRGRTDERGQLTLDVGEQPGSLLISSIGRGTKEASVAPPIPGAPNSPGPAPSRF